jgi:hypothetical protein
MARKKKKLYRPRTTQRKRKDLLPAGELHSLNEPGSELEKTPLILPALLTGLPDLASHRSDNFFTGVATGGR